MWKRFDNYLEAELTFADFVSAFSFMTRIAFEAEKMQHHPSWTNTYNVVKVRLSTHDAGDVITDKDEELAAIIERLYEKWPGRA